MTQTLKENLLYLKNSYPRIFKLIHAPNTDFYPCVKSKNGSHRIPCVDGKFVNSTIDPEEESDSFLKANSNNIFGKDVVVYGCGLGIHITELLRQQQSGTNKIYVVEKNVRLFKTCMGFLNLAHLLPKITFLLDMSVEDVVETIQKNSQSISILNFIPTSRLDKEYFDVLSQGLSKAFNKSDYLVEYFEKYLKKPNSSVDDVFEQIKKNEKFNKSDFKILLLEQIYKKNRKTHANFGN